MIYFILNAASSTIKIGYSHDPQKRLANLQTSHHDRLEIIGVIPGGLAEEARLHRQFAGVRLSGEWFRATPELLSAIRWLLNPAPRLIGQEIKSVYMAGHIDDLSWQEEILSTREGYEIDDWSVTREDAEWVAKEIVPIPETRRRLDYLGPFWFDLRNTSGEFVPVEGENYARVGSHYEKGVGRGLIRRRCLDGVRHANLVFAWIENNDCHQAISEITAAYLRRRQSGNLPVIAIATPPDFSGDDPWFLLGMAAIRITDATTAGDAWTRLWTRDHVEIAGEENASPPIKNPDSLRFRKGSHVFHPKYGHGEIVAIEGDGEKRKGRVAFASEGEKTFVLAQSPLSEVG